MIKKAPAPDTAQTDSRPALAIDAVEEKPIPTEKPRITYEIIGGPAAPAPEDTPNDSEEG